MRQPLRPDATYFDEVVDASLKIEHEGDGLRLASLKHQDCSAILDHNKEVMAQGGTRSTSFGQVELTIPVLVLQKLKAKYPDLESPDKDTRVKAWKKFARSTEAKPWRVSQRKYA